MTEKEKFSKIEIYRKKEEKLKEAREELPELTKLEFPTERPEKKLGVTLEQLLKLRSSERPEDLLFVEKRRLKIKEKLGKEITKEEKEKIEHLEKEVEKRKKEFIDSILTLILYEKGLSDMDPYVRRYTAESLGELAKVNPKLASTLYLYEKGLSDKDEWVRQGTAISLGELAKVNPKLASTLYEKGLSDKDEWVRQGTAISLGELAKVNPKLASTLYEKGLSDKDEWVRQGTAISLGELAKVNPKLASTLYEKGLSDKDLDVRRYTAKSLGELAKVNLELYKTLYEKGLSDEDPLVKRYTAESLGELTKVNPELVSTLYEKGLSDEDPDVRQCTAESLGELAKVNPKLASTLYEKGLSDMDPYVRRYTAKSLGELAKVNSELYKILYEKGLSDEDSEVRLRTAKSLGELAKVQNFEMQREFEKILDKIGIKEKLFTNIIAMNLILEKKDLGELVLKYIPEYRAIKEYSKEINKELPEDKKTKDPDKFWQTYEFEIANLLSIDLKKGSRLINLKLKNFGFPRVEGFFKATKRVYLSDKVKESISKALPKIKDLDPEFFGSILEISDAYLRMGFEKDLLKIFEKIKESEGTTFEKVIDSLGKTILEKFSKKLGIKTEIKKDAILKWNLEYLPKLFLAEANYKPEDKELLKLIMKVSFQEEDFKEVIFGKLEGSYQENEIDWLEEIESYNKDLKELFLKSKIDFELWYKWPKKEIFRIGAEKRVKQEKKARFNQELYETIVALLGSKKLKKEGILSKEEAKNIFKRVFKKYGIQFKDNKIFKGNKELSLKDLEIVLSEFKNLIEEIHKKEKEERKKQVLGTSLDHLKGLLTRIPHLEKEIAEKGYELSVSLWQREPGYDIFQGNYTDCCIAVENFNRGAILDYLIDSGLQIVEVKDETEGKTIAQTYLWIASDEKGNLNLILDNVEINADYLDISKEIRDHLFKYIEEFAKKLSPEGKIKKILLGTAFNDIPTEDLEPKTFTLKKLGGSPREDEYLDAIGSLRTDPGKGIKTELFIVKDLERLPKKPKPISVEVFPLTEISKKELSEIYEVEELSFPFQMRATPEDLLETLKNKKGVQLVLKDEKGKIVGYLCSKPLVDAFKELKEYDEELSSEPNTLYIESIAIRPENRSLKAFLKLSKTLLKEAKEKGYKKLTAYARVQNNLSSLLQKLGAEKKRRIENWLDTGEPFDYLEIKLEE